MYFPCFGDSGCAFQLKQAQSHFIIKPDAMRLLGSLTTVNSYLELEFELNENNVGKMSESLEDDSESLESE